MISQTSEYALRAVVHLARQPDGAATAKAISAATQVPVGYLQKVLRMLARAKILEAQRGTGGGFALAQAPAAVSVLDVLNATDNEIARIERCPLGIKGHTRLCALHRMLDRELANAERAFASTSIADLLTDSGEAGPLCDVSGSTGLTVSGNGGSQGKQKQD